MGLLTELVKISIKVAAAPLYIPCKLIEKSEKSTQYDGLDRDPDDPCYGCGNTKSMNCEGCPNNR